MNLKVGESAAVQVGMKWYLSKKKDPFRNAQN